MQTVEINGAIASPSADISTIAAHPMVGALIGLAAHWGQPISYASLTNGIDVRWDNIAESTGRLCRRARCRVVAVKRTLEELTAFELPALVILKSPAEDDVKNQDACILLEKINDTRWRVISGKSGGIVEWPADIIAQHMLPEVYLLSRDPTYSPSAGTEQIDGDHWLKDAIKLCTHEYIHAGSGTVVVNLLSLALPLVIMVVYDRVIPNQAMESLTVLSIGMLLVAASDFVLRLMRSHVVDVASRRIDTVLGNHLFERLIGAKMGTRFDRSGSTANTLRELDLLREFLNSSTLVVVGDLPFLVLFLLALSWISGPVAWIPLVLIVIAIIGSWLCQMPLNSLTKQHIQTSGSRNAVLIELLNGLESIKSSGAESWAAKHWEQAHANTVRSQFATRLLSQLSVQIIGLIQSLCTLLVLVYGVYSIHQGTLSMGGLFAAVVLSGRAMAPLAQIIQVVSKIHSASIAYQDLNRLVELPQERPLTTQFLHVENLQGEITLNSVEFAYPKRSPMAPPSPKVLKGISFTLRPEEHIAIVGPIGSGKSTLLKLLLKLYDPTVGQVLFDNIDLAHLDPADVRHHIGYVPQNPHFFSGTLRDNILLNFKASDDELIQAAQRAGVTDWLKDFGVGFNFFVAERGENISGGQRQSIALARALVRRPKILLLDEPTSLLDSRTEALFVQNLKLIPGVTLIAVTHRPALLSAVDRLIVLDRGQVVCDGPREQVLRQLGNPN